MEYKTEIMQQVLKIQYISLLPIWTKSISGGHFYVCLHMGQLVIQKLNTP